VTTTIQAGSAVRISWPSDSVTPGFKERFDGKVGTVLSIRGQMRDSEGEYRLYLVDIPGEPRGVVLADRHLCLLRPDLEEFVQSTKFALVGDDIVHDYLGPRRYGAYESHDEDEYDGDISTCQSCGQYHDGIRHKACPSCGGYLG
jgi:ribosomal protein L32